MVSCPLCKSCRLSIFSDAATGGQWHYCDHCQSFGDMIELAAKTWELSIPATIARLSAAGFEFEGHQPSPEAVRIYQAHYPDRIAAMRKLWQDSQANFIKGSVRVASLMEAIKLRTTLTGTKLQHGPVQLLGGTQRYTVESLFLPGSFTTNGFAHSEKRVFRGRDWKDVLVMPFYDLPERVRAFLFIGREGKDPIDHVFRSLYLDTRQQHGIEYEAGLAFHPQTLRPDDAWDGSVFAIGDAVLSVRLQQRHFQFSPTALPLVAWRDDGKHVSRHAWQMFAGRRVVFWSPTPTAQVIRQAMIADGHLVLGHAAEYWGERLPKDSLARIAKSARQWQEALAIWFKTAADVEIEELFHSLRLLGEPTNKLLEKCRPSVRSRIAEILKQELVQNSVPCGRDVVIEQADGWYAVQHRRNGMELIADACLRIDRVIHRPTRKETYYQGHVLYRGEAVSFCVRRELIEKNTLRWMQDLLLNQEKGFMKFESRWNSKIVPLALQLHPPEFLTGADAVGWDERRSCFVLPAFTLLKGGKTEPNPHGFFGEDSPATLLTRPGVIAPDEAQAVTEDLPEHRTAWAATGCLLANILAPAFAQQTAGLALVGRGAETVGRSVARALGCTQRALENARRRQEDALAAEVAHRWPTYVEIPLTTLPTAVARWLEAGGRVRNAAAPLDWLHAVPAQFMGSWRLLQDDASNSVPGAFTAILQKIVPAYLSYLMSGEFLIPCGEGWLPGVVGSLADWLESLGGSGATVRGGLSLVTDDTPEGVADSFGGLLCKLYADGSLTYASADFAGSGKPTLTPAEGGGLNIPKTALSLLPTKGRLEIDPLKVTEVLASGGYLLGETEQSWIVPQTWWSGKLHAWRAVRARLLRVKT